MSKNAAPGTHPLRAARERRGWTTYELAQRAEMAQTTVWRIEARRHHPNSRTLAKLAKALGVHIVDLLEVE